jgi:small subunit ribosomal protein S2
MKDLLEAGVHFGHQTKRWNPKMKEYIFGERNGIYIMDLGKTAKLFRIAEEFVMNLASDGRTILFVGTKRQAQDAIAEEAQRCGMFYVNQRWLGGLLTNFSTIQRSLGRLRDLEAMSTDGRYDTLSKKEIASIEKERRKPGNDDALRAIRLFASRIAEAVIAGRTARESVQAESEGDDPTDDRGRRAGRAARTPRAEASAAV